MCKLAKIVLTIQCVFCILFSLIMFKANLVAGRHVAVFNQIIKERVIDHGELSQILAWATSIRSSMTWLLLLGCLLAISGMIGVWALNKKDEETKK